MNKISARCQREANAKFYYASQRMSKETKIIKFSAYMISIVPILLSFIPIPGDKQSLVFIATMFSFCLSILLEFTSSFMNNHKEKSILLNQLYESEITGTTFSKIEYDREMTNDLHELAIRKSALGMAGKTSYHYVDVPDEIEDKYGYLYLCRTKAAATNYLMSRMYAIYYAILAVLIILFISFSFVKNDTFEFLQLIIQFYPLVLPIIRNITASRKTMKNCTKLSADIDNFFADGDDTSVRLNRFIYYAQTLEFETMLSAPAIYSVFYKIFNKGLTILENGVTKRFIRAMRELQKEAGRITTRELNKEIVLDSEKTQLKLIKTPSKPIQIENTKTESKTKTPKSKAAKPKTTKVEKQDNKPKTTKVNSTKAKSTTKVDKKVSTPKKTEKKVTDSKKKTKTTSKK